jgi:hypothetical protein
MVNRSSAVRVGGCQYPRDVDERAGFPVVVDDGPAEAFRAVRVGGCQCPRGLSNNGTASGDSELKIAGFTTTGRRADRSRSRF